MRLFASVLASIGFLIAASTSSALTFNATATVSSGNPLTSIVVGDVVTINIRMANPAAVAIFGIGAGIQGWDNSILQFVSGEMNAGPYFCTAIACTAGLNNGLPFTQDENTGIFFADGTAVQSIAGVGNYVPIVQAISTTGRAGNGARDPGLDGAVNGGDAQFRVVFRVVAPGVTTVNIGTNPNPILGNVVVLAGGATEEAINAIVLVGIPEPGTALLMGLGLAGLAGVGRRG